MNYSNPRTVAEFTDWPHGSQRTSCTFKVETVKGRGQRVARTTVDPRSGRVSKPKTTTCGLRAAIVDGDDGRTYVATVSPYGGMVSVMQSNLDFSAETIHDRDPRYAPLLAAINALENLQ